MRLNWFSPLPPQPTDVANFTARLAPHLMRRFEVTFWTDLPFDAGALPGGARVRQFDAPEAGRACFAELFSGASVYNLGNDARFHGGIFQMSRTAPGLAVLHDTRLHHFLFELFRNDQPPWAGYVTAAAAVYGKHGERWARDVVASGGALIDDVVEGMPFLETVAAASAGVVCHSRQAAAEVRARSSVPVLTLPLPFPAAPAAPERRSWSPPWRLIVFGFLNPNRRLESILQALATLDGEVEFELGVYGTLWDEVLVRRWINDAGLAGRVTLHGYVSDDQLDAAIAAAHATFNLRLPTMGEASGAILRSWAQATPAVVSDQGWYADLPDAVARKISSDREVADIAAAVRSLDRWPAKFQEMGVAAAARLAAEHSPAHYADALSAALADLPDLARRRASRLMLQRAALWSPFPAERARLLPAAEAAILSLFD